VEEGTYRLGHDGALGIKRLLASHFEYSRCKGDAPGDGHRLG
jgi:hypothetical protein